MKRHLPVSPLPSHPFLSSRIHFNTIRSRSRLCYMSFSGLRLALSSDYCILEHFLLAHNEFSHGWKNDGILFILIYLTSPLLTGTHF